MKIVNAQTLKKDSIFSISRMMQVSEVTEKSPKAVELLSLYGLTCASCFLNAWDTIEDGSRLHGMTDEEIDIMISEVNIELGKEELE